MQWIILVCWPYRIIMYYQWNRMVYGILNLLQSIITFTYYAMLCYNGKWNIPRQGGLLLGYSFTGTNKPNKIWHSFTMQHQQTQGCHQASFTSRGSLYGIHKSQVVRWLFFRQSDHAKYSEKLIQYKIK